MTDFVLPDPALIVVRCNAERAGFDSRAADDGDLPGDAENPADDLLDEMRDADVLGSVFGHFSVFDTPYRISSWWEGDFIETVARGSFTKTMTERRDRIVSAFDHGFDPTIGDKVLGPFTRLEEDDVGAAYAIDLLDTSYNRDLMPALKRGLYGSSFRFQVLKDEWDMEPDRSDSNPDALPERTVKEVRLFEAGPVTYPASPSATAKMRGATDQYYELLAKRNADHVAQLKAHIVALRTAGKSAATGTDPTVAAPLTNEPAQRHSGYTHAQRRARIYPYLRGN